MHGGFVEVRERPGHRALRRRRARASRSTSSARRRAKATPRRASRADADDEDAQQALLRAEHRLDVAGRDRRGLAATAPSRRRPRRPWPRVMRTSPDGTRAAASSRSWSRGMRRLLAGVVALRARAHGVPQRRRRQCLRPVAATMSGPAADGPRDLRAFEGLGTWVDVYDYVPALPGGGRGAGGDAEDGRRHGRGSACETLYLQAAQDDAALARRHRRPGAPRRFLRAGHRAGVRGRRLVPAALRRRRRRPPPHPGAPRLRRRRPALRRHRRSTSSGPTACPTPPPATARSSTLSQQVRDAAGDRPVGAIVLEPVLLEVVNQAYWPDFPWQELGVAVRRVAADDVLDEPQRVVGYRDGFAYTDENIRRLRNNLERARRAGAPDRRHR